MNLAALANQARPSLVVQRLAAPVKLLAGDGVQDAVQLRWVVRIGPGAVELVLGQAEEPSGSKLILRRVPVHWAIFSSVLVEG